MCTNMLKHSVSIEGYNLFSKTKMTSLRFMLNLAIATLVIKKLPKGLITGRL